MPNLWTYEQKFNDLNTADLIGQDSWAKILGDGSANVVETDTPYEGTKHAKIVNIKTGRTLPSAIESGTMYFSVKRDANNSEYLGIYLCNQNSVSDVSMLFQSDGKIYKYSNGDPDWVQISDWTYNANTYYRIGIIFEQSANAYEGLSQRTWKVNLNGGAWQGPFGMERTNGTSITRIDFHTSSPSTKAHWFDYISPNYSGVTTNIKKVAGVAYADLKKITGVAIANVKKVAGVSCQLFFTFLKYASY